MTTVGGVTFVSLSRRSEPLGRVSSGYECLESGAVSGMLSREMHGYEIVALRQQIIQVQV